jgi:branched-chain amino acid transport system permease protein
MDVLVVSILAGISYGLVLFLIATGLSLTLGLMGIVNVAHGAIFMTGAYFGLIVAKFSHNLMAGIFAGALLATIVGFIIDRGFLQHLYKRELEQILVTFGFVYIITNVHLWIYGAWPKSAYVPTLLNGTITIGRFGFPIYRILVIFISSALCLALWWLQEKTKIGAIIRAGMQDAEMLSGTGINLAPINIGAFCLSAFLAGLGGVIGAPVLGGVDLSTGTDAFFLAIAVCIIGGVGSVQGALVGALLLGITTALVATYLPLMSMFVMYILMVVILVFRPSGLLGSRDIE